MFSLGDKIIDEENSCLNSSWIDNNNENNSCFNGSLKDENPIVSGGMIDENMIVSVEAGLMTKSWCW